VYSAVFTASDPIRAAGRSLLEQPGDSHSGVGADHQLSPKTSLILTPLQSKPAQLDIYVNYGHGFHSLLSRTLARY
jgi:hypothetical protein